MNAYNWGQVWGMLTIPGMKSHPEGFNSPEANGRQARPLGTPRVKAVSSLAQWEESHG